MRALVSIELEKLKKRRATWILLAILLAFLCLIFFGYYLAAESSEYSLGLKQWLQFPDTFEYLLFPNARLIGGMLLAIITAFVIGDEYKWGTTRYTVARTGDRFQYLGAKVVSLIIIAIIVIFISLVMGVGLASITTSLTGELSLDFIDLSLAGRVARMFGGTVLAVVAYAFLAFLFTTLGRSAWAGIGGYLGYTFILETTVLSITTYSGGWMDSISRYLISPNSDVFIHLEEYEEIETIIASNMYPNITQATLVLLAWCILLGGISFYVFKKRDITIST
jgi:ABC-type transport system involved in multi-copper enzyme maturation permease subunit